MNVLAIASALLAVTCFLLAAFILKNSQLFLHRLWALFNISVGIWGTGIFFASLSKDPEIALRYWQFAHCGGFFVSVFFYHVVHKFCELKEKIFLRFVYAQAILFFLLNLFGAAGYKVVYSFDSLYYVKAANFVYVFVTIFWFAPVIYGHIVLLRSFGHVSGQRRNQMKYLFVSMLIGFSGGAQHFFPVYNINIYPYGNFLITIYTLIATYAIVKHRLMDIEVVIKKTLVFTGIFAFFFGTFAFLSFLVTDVLQRSATLPVRLAIFAVGAAVSALVGNRLHTFLVNATDRFLFQKKYVYYRILKENSKQMAFIHSLDELAKQITGFLVKQGRVKNAAIFVQSDDGQHYVLKFPLGYGGRTKRPTITLDQNHPLVALLSEYRGPIQTEELESKKDTDYQEALRILKLLKAEVVVPSFLRTASHENEPALKPRNILILGSKKSDQPYGEEDLDVFFTIAQDSAIAAENARLFDVVLKEREAKIKAEHIAERVWFAGTIKHEVKNRLAAGIIGPANILRIHHTPDLKKAFEEGDKEWFQEIFSKIENINKGLLDGAQMVLDIADTTLGGLEPDQTKFRRIYFKILWNDAKRASGIEKHCDFESSVPDGFVIYGNYPVIMRVFENLLTNAYDAMEDQNEKLIKLRCSYQQVEGKQVSYCELEDNGHGIPEDIQSKIFERGFSTKPEPDDKDLAASGHGQGLYVCKMNVEKLHGGKIWVESKVGKGTIFKLWIPTGGSNNAEK